MLQLRDGMDAPTAVRREDYRPPSFWIDTVDLSFDLDPARTRVLNRMTLRRNPQNPSDTLRLSGEELNLARVLLNGQGTATVSAGWSRSIRILGINKISLVTDVTVIKQVIGLLKYYFPQIRFRI